ncbi:hypothetical protein E2320_006777, partial [Naja naja]
FSKVMHETVKQLSPQCEVTFLQSEDGSSRPFRAGSSSLPKLLPPEPIRAGSFAHGEQASL